MLQIDNVSHSYDNKILSIKDISFDLKEGEVLSLLGPSGCGKSTLLRLIAGFEIPKRGEIMLRNQIISSSKWIKSPEKRGMGFVFQSYALFPNLNIVENINFGSQNKKNKFEEIIEEMNLIELLYKYPHELSGGEQQRVALARSIISEPSLILLDEPFSSLDTRLKDKIRDKMLHLIKKRNISSILVTHDSEDAMYLSDRIVVLNDGKIVQIGRPNDLYLRPKSIFVAEFFGEVNKIPANTEKNYVSSIFGNFPNPSNSNCKEVVILIRQEGINILNNKTKVKALVVNSKFLGKNTFVHLSLYINKKEIHLHARIPGINSFTVGSDVYIDIDKDQVFIFPLSD